MYSSIRSIACWASFPTALIRVGGPKRDVLCYQADRGDFGPGDADDLIEQMVATYQRGETATVERVIAGSGRTVKINKAPTPEGGYVSIVTDITERKWAEAELAGKEAHLRVALDNMPGGIRLVDGIIAFFGDPETQGAKKDARACVNMAIAMQRRMRELRSEWLDMGLEHPFEIRMGINTGYCTVGNFGSKDRMDYTIIGNEVNLAARLESQSEIGGILLAHETYSLVKDTVLAEESDAMTVKRFAKQVRTYSVVGRYDDLADRGRVIRKEQGAVRILIDLKRGSKAEAILAVKDVLSQLEG